MDDSDGSERTVEALKYANCALPYRKRLDFFLLTKVLSELSFFIEFDLPGKIHISKRQ